MGESDNIFSYASRIRSALIRYLLGDMENFKKIADHIHYKTNLIVDLELNNIKILNYTSIDPFILNTCINESIRQFIECNKSAVLELLMLIPGDFREHYKKLLENTYWLYDMIYADNTLIIRF